MKRSVAMMACVLSGAMVLGSFSPVMAETEAKAVSATVTDSKSSDDKRMMQKLIQRTKRTMQGYGA